MKRLDESEGDNYLKALCYGNPGTGKTSFGVTAPKPLILLSERQGMTHIRQAAKRLGIPIPPVVLIETAQDYRDVYRSLSTMESAKELAEPGDGLVIRGADGGERTRFKGYWPETVVFDSFTDAQKIFADEINRQSPPREGKDGLPVLSERFWGVFQDRIEKLVRLYRDLPMHVIFLALADDRIEGEGDDAERKITPMSSMRKIPGMLAAAVNVVGISYRRAVRQAKKDDQQQPDVVYEYGITTCGASHMMTKPMRPLRDNEVPDFASWVQRVRGELAPSAAPPEPDAPDEAAIAGDAKPPKETTPPTRQMRKGPAPKGAPAQKAEA